MGLGPGGGEGLTEAARRALTEAQVVVGYRPYLELAGDLIEGKDTLASGMTRELDRASQAIDAALEGKDVAVVSSGDPGIYAMAAVVFEAAAARGLTLGDGGLAVEVVPGVPAVCAAAALLGAPLSHDFCTISLSDRLTPWELIEKRLEAAGQADFVVAIYNPKSKGRPWQFGRALEILAAHRAPETPVGVVNRAGREGEAVTLTTLASAGQATVDMQTLVIIGNSQTYAYGGRMVTPRGYLAKYGRDAV